MANRYKIGKIVDSLTKKLDGTPFAENMPNGFMFRKRSNTGAWQVTTQDGFKLYQCKDAKDSLAFFEDISLNALIRLYILKKMRDVENKGMGTFALAGMQIGCKYDNKLFYALNENRILTHYDIELMTMLDLIVCELDDLYPQIGFTFIKAESADLWN